MVKITLIKSPDEWATTKQVCWDELVVYVFLLPQYIHRSTPMYWALFYETFFYIHVSMILIQREAKNLSVSGNFPNEQKSFTRFMSRVTIHLYGLN